MYSTLDECRNAWEKAGQHGSKEDRIARNRKWIQYYQHMARQQEDKKAAIDPHAKEVVDYLTKMGYLHDHVTALDIGSGTGTYALAFADHCASVNALDMDAASLSVLEQRAIQSRHSNIQCTTSMWENFDTSSKFSLTFSAMCPAICSYDDLLKMESLTSQTCCLIAVTRGSYDLHRKNLMELMEVKPKGGMTTEALWYYKMLYLMGRQPDVKNWTQHYEYEISVAEACNRNEVYFQIFGIQPETSRPQLEAYFESKAIDGLVHDVTHLNTALICWRP